MKILKKIITTVWKRLAVIQEKISTNSHEAYLRERRLKEEKEKLLLKHVYLKGWL